jgi:hypothetical protein
MLRRQLLGLASASLLAAVSGCGSTDDTNTVPLPQGVTVFAYGLDPAQTVSLAPFPNDLYRGAEGIALAPLASDPLYATLAKKVPLAELDAAIKGRPGFGFAQPIQLFSKQPIALASLEGRVHLVAMDGPEAGREVAVESWWSDEASALTFFPAPGDWLMPDSTYVLAIDPGITTETGESVGATASMAEVLSPERSATNGIAWDRAAPLRAWTAEHGVPVIGMAFRTEPSLAPLEALLAAVTSAELPKPSREVRYDPMSASLVMGKTYEGADLDKLYGIASAPFATNPGSWDSGTRQTAKVVANEAYTGGSVRARVAKAMFGSITVPAFNFVADGDKPKVAPLSIENGVAKSTLTTMVPMTMFLCEGQLANAKNLPVAIFTHGGTATRNNAMPLAAMNCQKGVATVALDLPFHGGRSEFTLVNGRIVPKRADVVNELTGLKEGDMGFEPDGVGDPAGADSTVGNLFGLNVNLNPGVIEANLLTVPTELAALVRLLGEANWSEFHPALTFDTKRLFLENLSFGTTFTTGYLALSDTWSLAVGSTGSGHILGANLTVAPSNAALATTVVKAVLGLKSSNETLANGAYRDPVGGLYSWLVERGDSMAFAPYVLRHRKSKTPRNIVQTGDSWDETLSSASQLRFNAALGLQVLESDGWTLDPTVPGADTLNATKAGSETQSNVTFDGVKHSAAIFFNSDSCHAQLVTPLCHKRYEKVYPAVTPLAPEKETVKISPICAIHAQGIKAIDSLLAGSGAATIVPPIGDCDTVYGK